MGYSHNRDSCYVSYFEMATIKIPKKTEGRIVITIQPNYRVSSYRRLNLNNTHPQNLDGRCTSQLKYSLIHNPNHLYLLTCSLNCSVALLAHIAKSFPLEA